MCCPSQLVQEEGLERSVVEEEGKGGHAMLGRAALFAAGPLAEHSRAQRTWKQILIFITIQKMEKFVFFSNYFDN